jgi:hypothetical protein
MCDFVQCTLLYIPSLKRERRSAPSAVKSWIRAILHIKNYIGDVAIDMDKIELKQK